MVQESRSFLIQQLLQGGFKEEDDDDEDEDEAHELTKRHLSDERQGFGRKNHTDQKELIHGVSETRGLNKGARDDATKKQAVLDFDSNAVNRQKLLASKPLKDAKADVQSSIESCLLPEQEIIREGSKKLLQIHSEFLVRQYPPLQHIKGPVQEPGMTLKDSNYISKNCCRVQKQQLEGGEGSPSLATTADLVSKNNGESDGGTIGEAQQNYGPVISGQHALQFALTQSATTRASPEEDEHRRRCFAALNSTKKAARELNVNISFPNISTDFEKKSSISGCTESFAIDQGSSTDSVIGGDEFIEDVTSADKTSKHDELDVPKGGHFYVFKSSKDKRAVESTVCITRAKDVVPMPQQVEIPATQLEIAESGKNQGPETTDSINDCRIEMTAEYKQAENKNPLFHVSEENHVEFLSEGHETAVSDKARFRSSVFEHSTAKVIDKISTVLDSSNIAVEERPSGARSFSRVLNSRKHSALFVHLGISEEEEEEEEEEIEDYKTTPTKKVGDPISTALHCFAVSHGAAEPASLGHAGWAEQAGEADSVKVGKAIVDARVEKEFQQRDVLPASDNLTCNVEKTQLTESLLKTRTDAASLRTCLSEEMNRGDDPVEAGNSIEDGKSLEKVVASEKEETCIFSSRMNFPKEQLADILHLDTVHSACNESETVNFTSSEEKLKSPIVQATKILPDEGPVISPDEEPVRDTQFLVNPPAQDVYVSPQKTPIPKSTLQADTRGVTLEHSEVITPTIPSSLNWHSAFAVQDITLQKDQAGWCPDPLPTQSVETVPINLNIPTAESVPAQPHNSDAISSPLDTTPPKLSPKVDTAGAPVNVRNIKADKPLAASSNANSNGKAGTSRQKSKKKKARVHPDARTVVFVRSDTRVAYNGPHLANPDFPLPPQDITQHNAMANVMNPSYDFAQSTQAFMRHETDRHLMQAQTSAQDAMVAATSALAQSHYEWSRMQNQICCPMNTQAARSHLTIMREAQIASIAASVAAAAVVAKAAVEAARAIQEASKEALAQLGGSSQPNFGQSGFVRSAEMLTHRQGISEMANRQPVQFANPSKINTAGRKRKNDKRASSAPKDEIKTGDQTQHVGPHCLSHAELRDTGGANVLAEPPQAKAPDLLVHSDQKGAGVVRCIKGVSSGDEPDEVVEVMTEEVGLQGGWFVAKVLMKTDREAFVQYNELFRDDGCTPCRNLFPLSSIREEDAYGRTQQGDRRWLRPMHPSSKAWKHCRGSMRPQTWTIGNHVDVFSKGGWWEGIIVEIDKADDTNITIRFPGGKGIEAVKTWDVRPSLIWAGDDWRLWNENFAEEDDQPSSKRPKLDSDNVKTKREEPIGKDKSLKKLVEECKPISDPPGLRVSRRSSEARKNASRAIITNLGNNKCEKQTLRPSRQARVLSTWGSLSTSKKITGSNPSSTSLAAKTGTISTRLQLKTEAEKRKSLRNLVASKVIQKGVKTVSTRSETMKRKPKTIQTKLLKALKKTSHRKVPRLAQKK